MNEWLQVGVSGMSMYVPAPRVRLEDWCAWTGNVWPKVQAVVGRSFRMSAPNENVYTMAATAVLRLIDAYDVRPEQVGMLALGTESSSDNSAGAIIVKGMVDAALVASGRPALSRHVEVPETKHACLGGIYALKSALRYVATDGADRVAIVVSGDIAEYARGSTGEQTQGAGAVAMLVTRDPTLFSVDLAHAGSAASYRALDFRKPVGRHDVPGYADTTARRHDFPVFNGKFSTACYLDEVVHAFLTMAERHGVAPLALFDRFEGLFFHRPYHGMPVSGLAALYAFALVHSPDAAERLATLCQTAEVSLAAVRAEAQSLPDLLTLALRDEVESEPWPVLSKLLRAVRQDAQFKDLASRKLALGTDAMMDLGNLYTAALPAWIAAGLEQALERGQDLAGRHFGLIGYGSGDAAEALPMTVAPAWRSAAQRLGFRAALDHAVDLAQPSYEALHDGRAVEALDLVRPGTFVIDRVGERFDGPVHDVGVEVYRRA